MHNCGWILDEFATPTLTHHTTTRRVYLLFLKVRQKVNIWHFHRDENWIDTVPCLLGLVRSPACYRPNYSRERVTFHFMWERTFTFHPRCGKKLSLIRNGIPSTLPLFRPEGRLLEEVEIVWVFRFYLTVSSYSAQKMIRCPDDRLPRSFWSSVGHKLFGSNTHFGCNKLSQWDALLVPSKERRRKDMCRHWFGWTERMSMIGEKPFLSYFWRVQDKWTTNGPPFQPFRPSQKWSVDRVSQSEWLWKMSWF